MFHRGGPAPHSMDLGLLTQPTTVCEDRGM